MARGPFFASGVGVAKVETLLRTKVLKNRRVAVGRKQDGGWFLRFRRLENRRERKITELTIALSNEAMMAVMELVAQEMDLI
jgi:hypothetical protein